MTARAIRIDHSGIIPCVGTFSIEPLQLEPSWLEPCTAPLATSTLTKPRLNPNEEGGFRLPVSNCILRLYIFFAL